MSERKSITVRYPSKDKLLETFERRGPRGVLFVETGRRMELAEQVMVVVEFPRERRSFRLTGKVIARRRGSGVPALPPGVEVEFPGDQNQTLGMVLDHAEGKEVDFVDRKSRRLPCSFVVSYRRDQDFIKEFTEDIGEGGTFIRTDKLLPTGTEVECRLKPPGYLVGIKLKGKVAWLKEKGQPKGMGIEFLFANQRQRKKIKDLIRKLNEEQSKQVKKKMKKLRRSDRFR